MAYTLTKADVTAVAPELAVLDDPRWAYILAFAQARCANSDAFGGDPNAKMAATYLAAHLAKLDLQAMTAKGGTAGPVLSVKAGPVERTYDSLASLLDDSAKALDPSLGLTRYGLIFRGFQRSFSFSRGFVA